MQVSIITARPFHIQNNINRALESIKDSGCMVVKIDITTIKSELNYSIFYATPDEIREGKLSTLLDKKEL